MKSETFWNHHKTLYVNDLRKYARLVVAKKRKVYEDRLEEWGGGGGGERGAMKDPKLFWEARKAQNRKAVIDKEIDIQQMPPKQCYQKQDTNYDRSSLTCLKKSFTILSHEVNRFNNDS